MNTLKLVRAITVGTAMLAGVLSICILIFPSKALDMGITDGQFLVNVIVFLISTLYYLAIDALIRRDEAVTEDMKRIHQTTLNQCLILISGCLVGIFCFMFL